MSWPQFRAWGTYDSGSVRRGFQVFSANCANCHGYMGKKYDLLLDKVYEQIELSTWVADHFTIHPAHHHYKQFYYQEWDERDRYIHDHIYAPYYSQDQAKNANGGVWPTDFTKIRMRPGGINYIYNVLTGYYFKPPYGMDIPKGKHFNPYFDHMIIGMARQLYDGLIEYEDGTPASTPQMANDVSNFVMFLQRRIGWRHNDKKARQSMVAFGLLMLYPIKYVRTRGYYRSLLSTRTETYAVRDNLGYKHWKTGMKSTKATDYRNAYWT